MENISTIANKYNIHERIGKGKFGDVYKGVNKKTGENIAVKVESIRSPFKLLKHETTLLKHLYDHGCRHIPIVYWYGIWGNSLCLIMPFYENSLFEKLNMKHKTHEDIPIEKINSIMNVCIEMIESVHCHFVLHRDIKPQNFMFKSGRLYLIDFGLSCFYLDENREHILTTNKNENIIGTPRYVSINIHNGINPSRRDDMISLGYIYIWMVCGELSWDNIIDDGVEINSEINLSHNKNKQRARLKSWEFINEISEKINQNVNTYLSYCYGLGFKDEPNYSALKQLFMPTQ